LSKIQELRQKTNKIVYVYDGDNEEDDKYFEDCYEIERKIFEKFDKYLYVKIYVDGDKNLIQKYDKLIEEHNRNIVENVGFSLISPINMKTEKDKYDYTLWLDVKCVSQLVLCDENIYDGINVSIKKDKYELQPIQGIKSLKGVYRPVMTYDINYIGNLRVDMNVSNQYEIEDDYTLIKKYKPVYDLTNDELDPVYVERVGTIEELYTTKVRM
jgi:hypothetical protein